MKKGYIVMFVIVVVGAGLFLFFRSQKKTEQQVQHNLEAFTKLSEIANKVPKAGLTQMGIAIGKYKEKNGSYPPSLMNLYPDFIPSKEFIEKVSWSYEVKGDNFILQKTIGSGERQIVASIDKGMIPRLGTELVVAAREPVKKEEKQEVVAFADLKPVAPVRPLYHPTQPKEEVVESLIPQPEIISVVEGEIGPGISTDMEKKFLVWRDENGVLGFGNVVYPESKRLNVYKTNRWLEIKRPPLEQASADISAGQQQDAFAGINTKFLVWKSSDGILGFGNVEYPRGESVRAYRGDGWIDVERVVEPVGNPPVFREKLQAKADSEEIAEAYSNQYLIWKDKKGNIGYGNVQYPEKNEIASICVGGDWQKVVN